MSVKLEKYLTGQRRNLDVESPDDAAIWEGIKSELQTKKVAEKQMTGRIRFIRIRNIAAIGIILFSLGYIANDIINGKMSDRKITLSSIDINLGHREMEYKTLVNFKTEKVRSFTGSDDKVIRELFEEIKGLDAIYDQSLSDLKELGPDEKVINIIFNTYEQKIRLLELIIFETNKINSHENNEKTIL
jgi:hypothetical protein